MRLPPSDYRRSITQKKTDAKDEGLTMPTRTIEPSLKSAGVRAAGSRKLLILALALLSATAASASGTSYYPSRLQDSKAVYLDSAEFSVHGDGHADDTEAW